MIKTSRKQSTDPIQEKLRQEKDSWNKDVSAFIDDVKHFKKLMNGYASKFHTDKSKISDPMPADPVTIISALVGDFNELSQRSSKIISYQLEYSKNRKKKQSVDPGTANKSADISLANANLASYGSNVVSRFFTRLLNPSFGDSEKSRIKRYRMTMLTSCVNISNNLEKLSRVVAQSSPESIFVSSQIITKIVDEFNFMNKGLETFMHNVKNNTDNPKGTDNAEPKGSINHGSLNEPNLTDKAVDILLENKDDERAKVKTKGKAKTEVTSNIVLAAEKAISDYRHNIGNFLDLDFDFKKLNSLVMSFVNSDMDIKNKIAKELLIAYNQLLLDINSRYKISGSSLKELFEIINKTNKSDIEIVAQSLISKYFGKLRHQMSLFDKTSAIRLDIYKAAGDAKKIINKIMDILEKDMNINELALLFSKVSELLYTITQYQLALNSTVKGKSFNKPFMNLLDNKTIFDHDLDLSEKQKINIRKNIEQKDVRELSKLYKF